MSRLSDLIHAALDAATQRDGTIDRGSAVLKIEPELDDPQRRMLINEAINARLTQAAKSAKASLLADAMMESEELPFGGLHGAYPLGLGDRSLKKIAYLTRAEFERVINIREKQITDDIAHVRRLRAAYKVLAPVWDRNPEWVALQCVNALIAAAQRAA